MALESAVDAEHTAMIEALLQAAADATQDIREAAADGHLGVLISLVKLGPGAEMARKHIIEAGGTALHHAVKAGHQAVVHLPLANGAGVDLKSLGPWSPALVLTVLSENTAIAQLILASSADIDAASGTFHHDTRHDLRCP